MQVKDDFIKSLQCSRCQKSGTFQKHIFDPKNETEASLLTNSKETVYLDGLPLLKTIKDIILKSLGHPMHQAVYHTIPGLFKQNIGYHF